MRTNHIVNTLASRFSNLHDLKTIKKQVTHLPERNETMTGFEPYQIKSHVDRQLRDLYIPTEQDLNLLQKFVGVAKDHHEKTYSSDIQYLQGLYTSYKHFEAQQQFPICLTGPAGVGKTSLLSALDRLLPSPTELHIEDGIGPIRLCTHWHMQAQARASFGDMVWPFIEQELGENKKIPTQSRAVGISSKTAFKSGVALIVVDEMQFLTQGHSAHAAITKLLYQLSHIGKPFVFAANYSLCSILKRRPEQDRQRLLSTPVVLTPSDPDSMDWVDYLRAVAHVLGPSLQIDIMQDRHSLYHLTAGLKRFVRQLLGHSYQLAWQKGQHHITMEEVKAAYDHTEYSVSREQAQAMLSPHSYKSAEYVCQFPLPKTKADALLRTQKNHYSEQLISQVQQNVLLKSEKKVLEETKAPKPSTRPKRSKLTADELRQANSRRLNQGSAGQ